MIVRCIANTGLALPAVNIDPRRGFDASTEFYLTIGRDYPVFGITVFLGTAWYYVLDDVEDDWPIWHPAALFDIVDGSLPASWRVGYFRFSHDRQASLISFPEWALDFHFYERLLDRDPYAARIFALRRREVEESCCDGLVVHPSSLKEVTSSSERRLYLALLLSENGLPQWDMVDMIAAEALAEGVETPTLSMLAAQS